MKINKDKLKKIILLGLGIFCLCLIFEALWGMHVKNEADKIAMEAKAAYENAKKEVESEPVPTPTPTLAPTPEPVPAMVKPEPPYEPEKKIRPEFEALIAEYNNEDIVGYLSVGGTTIEYPVLQYTDNEFYLEHDIYKKRNSAGTIFLDYENDISAEDMNMIIYGHNMKQDVMFHSIRNYTSKDFYEEHKYINFNTIYNDYVFEIFAFYVPNISFPYIYVNYSEEDYLNLLKEIKEMAQYETGIEVGLNDRILHLSTCSNQSSNTRLAVAAKLVEVNGVDYKEILAQRQAYEEDLRKYNEYIESQKFSDTASRLN